MIAADAAALAAGLRPGMAVTKAQVLVPGLLVEDHDAAADAAALERIAAWMLRFAPIVAADPPDGVVIDSTGADHLHGGEQAMLSAMLDRLAASGVAARAAVADTWGAAHGLARFAGQRIVVAPAGGARAALAPLPLAALRLPADTLADLRRLGLDRIGELLAQPRAPLSLRFGRELSRRIDQALGFIGEPIEPIRPAETVEVRRVFAEPISAAETITRHIAGLAVELCDVLAEKGLGARQLDLICHRVDSRAQALRVGTALPVRDPKRLTRLLTDRTQSIDPGFGIEILRLAAPLAEPLPDRQIASRLVHDAPPDVSDLVDVLSNRLGQGRLYRVTPVASDIPERSVRRIPAMAPEAGGDWPAGWPRPPRLLSRPEAIEALALLPDHPPVQFTWRGIRRRVCRADGPERVFGEWWRHEEEALAVRDYFRVEDEAGERYWIFRSGDGEAAATGSHRWFLHGFFG